MRSRTIVAMVGTVFNRRCTFYSASIRVNNAESNDKGQLKISWSSVEGRTGFCMKQLEPTEATSLHHLSEIIRSSFSNQRKKVQSRFSYKFVFHSICRHPRLRELWGREKLNPPWSNGGRLSSSSRAESGGGGHNDAQPCRSSYPAPNTSISNKKLCQNCKKLWYLSS